VTYVAIARGTCRAVRSRRAGLRALHLLAVRTERLEAGRPEAIAVASDDGRIVLAATNVDVARAMALLQAFAPQSVLTAQAAHGELGAGIVQLHRWRCRGNL
jgi:hypothetical protein